MTQAEKFENKNQADAGQKIIWFGILGILVLAGLLQGVRIYLDYRRTIEEAEDRLIAQARVIDENLSAKLNIVNLLFSNVAKMMNNARLLRGEEINKYLAYQDNLIPGIRTLGINDTTGRIVFSDRKEIIGLDASSRNYFRSAREAVGRDHLIISPPFRTALGNYVVNISKPLTGKRGEFIGVIAATLDKEYFITLLKSVLYSPDNRIMLVHDEGEVFLSTPDKGSIMNKTDVGAVLREGQRAGSGKVFTKHGIDASTGDGRIFVLVTTQIPDSPVIEHPLAVIASRDKAALLGPWRSELAVELSLYALFVSVTIAVTRVFLRRGIERKKIEEALRQGEEELKTLFTILPVGVSIIDQERRLLRANRALEKMLAITPEGIRKGDYTNRKYLKGDGTPLLEEEFPSVRALKEQREVLSLEIGVVKEDETTVWTHVSAAPLPGIGAAVVTMDITERKKAEEERLKSHVLESIGILAGGVAHDFNNLLTVVMGNISVAKLTINPDDIAFSRLTDTEQVCLMASDLCTRLIMFATGGEPVTRIMSLAGLLRETVGETIKGSGIQARFDLPDDLFSVAVDETQMKLVIVNLASNAKEAMPNGGTLTVQATNLSVSTEDNLPLREGNYIKISFSDTGPGIPGSSAAKVFDPYFSTKDTYNKKGLGLSLAVCYSLIKRHRGLITLESGTEGGTTFHVLLPRAE